MTMPVMLRFKGGPFDGKTMQGEGWPPPDVFDNHNFPFGAPVAGRYRKARASRLDDEQAAALSGSLIRGAEYVWEQKWRVKVSASVVSPLYPLDYETLTLDVFADSREHAEDEASAQAGESIGGGNEDVGIDVHFLSAEVQT